jgi:SAM-dependent methyltransferase
VGAGRGELAGALRSAGYVVVAIDPGSDASGVVPIPLIDVAEPAAGFDAAVAVLSMHHVEPLRESCRVLARVVRPGGILVLDEFDVERYDETAARWWLARRERQGDQPPAAELVPALRAHLHTVSTLRDVLSEWFELEEPVRGPYLYRWDLPPGLRAAEEDEIAAGRLPATGARLIGSRK